MKRFAYFTYLISCLLIFLSCSEGKVAKMRQGLDSINMVNRSGKPFTVADVEPYVQFFDKHGEPNDRLLAHYLLGLAYYDHGEAPMALRCYQDALDCVDTTSNDCDYAQLSRVYGQMANIFNDQGLYRQQLAFTKTSVKFAWQANDTLIALMNYEQESLAYKELGEVDSAILVIENVAKQYAMCGYPTYSAISTGSILRMLIKKGNLQKAKSYINIYEKESGLFDSLGNIAKGREIYYKIKGLYYLNINVIDSAEYYFRKELRDGRDFNNQNAGAKGLAELYRKLNKPDSVAKYYQYAYNMNDSIHTKRTAKDVERIKAMYDYSRYQEAAHQESEKAGRLRFILYLIAVTAVISIYLIYMYLKQQRRRKVIEIASANAQYAEILSQYNKSQEEMASLKSGYNHYQAEKQQEIERLQQLLAVYQEDRTTPEQWNIEHALLNSKIVSHLHQLAGKAQVATSAEWKDLREVVSEQIPVFYQHITDVHANLTGQEVLVCILCKLRFIPSEMVSLLNLSPQRITNLRSMINQKLFNAKGAQTLESHLNGL